MAAILKVLTTGNEEGVSFFEVDGYVHKVYDTNSQGHLLEIGFSQPSEKKVVLDFPSYGHLYFKYW